LLLPGGALRAEGTPSARVVVQLDAALLDTLKQAAALDYHGRFARLAPAITAAFDVPFMAEKSVGGHWKRLSYADRRRWLDLFREFTIANYAGNLDRYSGQRFDLLGEEPGARDTAVVHTRLIDPGGEDVDLNYRLRQVDGTWKIIDVYLRGTVSELALRRADYTAVLDRDGFEALITTLRARITDLAAGKHTRPG
jgi:phospholipid transport system substrate-binding protein